MEVGLHGPLSRAHTAPNGMPIKMYSTAPTSFAQSQAHTGSNHSIQTQPSSRASDTTTQGTTASTLFPAATPMTSLSGNSGHIEPSDNVMNKIGDKEQSLFQICVILRQRLKGVPDFDRFLEEEEQGADEDIDPVTLLWRTFRRGYPLVELYNVLKPDKRLEPDLSAMTSEIKKGKAMTFKFLGACIRELGFKVEDCFIILDLYGDDTTGFVKVTRMVTRILDILVRNKIIQDTRRDSGLTYENGTATKKSQRQHIVHEMVTTERTYVQQLELLQAFKVQCEKTGAIPGDVIHHIFLNLNSLLDFQRRFLIRVEQINAQPEEEQNWGKLFVLYNDAFKIYEPYITNQKLCEETVIREFDNLRTAGGSPELQGIVANPPTLYSFLMKPFQRLSKYPLLLGELYKKGDLDEQRKSDLLIGKECAQAVLLRTNDAMDREDKLEAVHELKNRVEDWKGHRVEGFGELLLFGTFTVVKSDVGPTKDAEREYHVYFFESILLCCKDIDPTKAKNKMKAKSFRDEKGKPKLQLKGRIFMQNVTDVVKATKAGTYTCQIFWKGDPGIENFTIRYISEEIQNKWYARLLEQKKQWSEIARSSDSLKSPGTSSTEFMYMQNQGHIENPYRQQDEEEDDDPNHVISPTAYSSHHTSSDFSNSRQASSSSLRSRSTTNDSGPPPNGPGRMGPPRFAPGTMPPPALGLRTQQLQSGFINSPVADPRHGESYFSPTTESPAPSSRGSSQFSTFPFPSQLSSGNGYHTGGTERHTAPQPLPYRSSSREGINNPATYAQNQRGPPRPGYGGPPPPGMQREGSRNRSVSSPNINEQQRRVLNSARPPMPEMPPSAYANQQLPYAHTISRSQSNSPHLPQGIDARVGNASPKLRDSSQNRAPGPPQGFGYDGAGLGKMDSRFAPPGSRSIMPAPYGSREQTMTPPLPSSTPMTSPDVPQPTQLKVKVHATAAGQVLTLVVPLNISYQSLKDRIDAKLQRSTNISLSDRGPNQVKLKYLDEDDYVSIQSDEDVQIAFETWREQRGVGIGGMGEIELFCQ